MGVVGAVMGLILVADVGIPGVTATLMGVECGLGSNGYAKFFLQALNCVSGELMCAWWEL